MNVLIVAEYLGDIESPNAFNSRFLTVTDMLLTEGHNVQIVTTDFIHHLKKHIFKGTKYKSCEIVTLKEPGYEKNVSLKRFYSHYILSKNLKKWLKGIEKPDVIYCAVPSLDFAYEAAKYAEDNNIKFVLDIQDLWPEAFEMVFNIPFISKLVFAPFRKRANYIYSMADEIIAVSQTYVDRALENNVKCKLGRVVYLGTSLSEFDKHKQNKTVFHKEENELWLAYVGTLGHSYDLKTVIDALTQLKKKSYYKRLKFVVMGDGPLRKEFEKYANDKFINIKFLGMLPYPQMVSILSKADIVINPIKRKSAGTIINKHADYAASGLPVINTQECEEYRNLVAEWNMGINCECENSKDVSKYLDLLVKNETIRRIYGENARRCAKELFDREKTYKKIVEVIIN